MSKIGKRPIAIPSGVSVDVSADKIVVKGPKGSLEVNSQSGTKINIEDNNVVVERLNDEGQSRSNHGLVRSLLANAIQGVVEPFSKTLSLVGVGYRAKLAGKDLEMALGFSHPIKYPMPAGIDAAVPDQTTIVISGIDKQKVGQIAAEIRSFRPPEPYKGKGVRYVDEHIVRKAGKSGGK